MQGQCFIELASFDDFARYLCALRQYPLRAYSHKINGKKVISSGFVLSNTVLLFYTPLPKQGRYISYSAKGGKEYCKIVDSTKEISHYAPIISLDSKPTPFKTKTKRIKDKFFPIKVSDLGSLARLTYDPEMPEEPNLTLFLIPHKKKWLLGYITSIETEDEIYCFYYVKLDNDPKQPFLKYLGREGKDPEFSDSFEHGYPYLSIIKLKKSHFIFGLD